MRLKTTTLRSMQNVKNKTFIIVLIILLTGTVNVFANRYDEVPYSVNNTHLTVWNGNEYVPINIKGINLGVALPGKFPSELTPTYEMYYEWFEMIRAAGFNTIRLYTLHYPRFYQALKDYNTANSQSPLLILHGVWLEEELEGYNADLYFLNDVFNKEIEDNINCVHGNNQIDFRWGKAHGTYTADISEWVLGYIIGREVHPHEVKTTNEAYPELISYTGNYLSVENVKAAEVFVTTMMDKVISFEQSNYATIRPVSFSSWPTLDPLTHPTETQTDEDIESVDISGIDFSKTEAGIFVSYHAYPYYPDFISKEPSYLGYKDIWGQNSYIGYLTDLKSHYANMPLIIAEFGVPSSWGVAHYAHSGMNHGGVDETEQGLYNIRMLDNMMEAGCGGGIMFAWIDEWFKRTWITDPMDFLMDRRIIWHNITAAEQNFGLIGFNKSEDQYANLDFTNNNLAEITKIEANADFKFLKLKLETTEAFGNNDTLWIGIDSYDATLGESVLPNGSLVTDRAEFALMITAYKAELYVTQAYDLYAIWHGTSAPEQLYRSVATDGDPWRIARFKNNDGDNYIQYVGSLGVNRLDLPLSSMDAVVIKEDEIEIKLPWTLINFVDPSTYLVMHDDRSTSERELIASDGVKFSVFYKGGSITTNNRYLWEKWNHAENNTPYIKSSYNVIQEHLPYYQGALVANIDSFSLEASKSLLVNESNSLVINDKNYDGGNTRIIIEENTKYGILMANQDGSFSYTPDQSFVGTDTFAYSLSSGLSTSQIAKVLLKVEGVPTSNSEFISIGPNPSSGKFSFNSAIIIDRIEIYNTAGEKVLDKVAGTTVSDIDLTGLPNGNYFAKIYNGDEFIVKRLLLAE